MEDSNNVPPRFADISRNKPQQKTKKPREKKKAKAKRSAASNVAGNIAILQNEDILSLRLVPGASRTFRFLDEETEWLEDQAHQLSKKIPDKKKVTQTDLVRLSIKILEAKLKERPGDIEAILQVIKQ